LAPGHQLKEARLLFDKIDDEAIEHQLEKLEDAKKANAAAKEQVYEVQAQKETIEFDDFTKLDLRIGKILEAEKIPKTKKLLKFKVDTGIDQRTIVSGIAEHFKPEELIGKRVSIVANLKPIKLRGVRSEGMILMTENSEGKIVFVNPDETGVPNGATIN